MRLFIVFASILILSMAYSVQFEGSYVSLSDLNMENQIYDSDSCMQITPIIDSNYSGVYGILLHANFSKDEGRVVIRDENGNPIRHRGAVGSKILINHYYSEFQNGYLFINLEEHMSNSKISVCVFPKEDSTATIYNDTLIGLFKIPNFSCGECFVKTAPKDKVVIGENTPITINFVNKGFAKASDIEVFYDSEVFTNHFKLKSGNPSWIGNLDVNKGASISYNLTPEVSKGFVISPSVISYMYNEYIFKDYSNNIIIRPLEYLDSIECDVVSATRTNKISEESAIEVLLFNDSNQTKSVNLSVKGSLDKNIEQISLNSLESKTKYITLKSDVPKSLNIKVSISKDGEEKICGAETIEFKDDSFNSKPYVILLLIIISIATVVYYRYYL